MWLNFPPSGERVRGDIQDAHHIGGALPSLKVSKPDLDRFISS